MRHRPSSCHHSRPLQTTFTTPTSRVVFYHIRTELLAFWHVQSRAWVPFFLVLGFWPKTFESRMQTDQHAGPAVAQHVVSTGLNRIPLRVIQNSKRVRHSGRRPHGGFVPVLVLLGRVWTTRAMLSYRAGH